MKALSFRLAASLTLDAALIAMLAFLVYVSRKRDTAPTIPPELLAAPSKRDVGEKGFPIFIDRTGHLSIGPTSLNAGELHRLLNEAARSNPQRRVRIDGVPSTPIQAVTDVVRLCKLEGLRNVRLYVRPVPKR